MPYTTGTGRVIEDSFFAEHATELSNVYDALDQEHDVELHPDFVPLDDPLRVRLAQMLVNDKVPGGLAIRVVVRRIVRYVEPEEPRRMPAAFVAPNCEVYEFAKETVIETRKYLTDVSPELLFSIRRKSDPVRAWVLFCGADTPKLLLERKADNPFPKEPPPLPADGSPWFWMPQDLIDVSPDLYPGGAGSMPELEAGADDPGLTEQERAQREKERKIFQDPRYSFKYKIVLELVTPIRISGCHVEATYRYVWKIQPEDRMNPGPPHPKVITRRVRGTSDLPVRKRIPNCPRTPSTAPRLTAPNEYMRSLSPEGNAGFVGRAEGEARLAAVRAVPTDQPGVLRIESETPPDWLSDPSTGDVHLLLSGPADASGLSLPPEWAEHVAAVGRDSAIVRLTGRTELTPDGILLLNVETGSLFGLETRDEWGDGDSPPSG